MEVFRDDRPLSPSRVLRLCSTLGEDSALVAAERGGMQYRGWTTDRYLMRKLLFTCEQIVYVTAKANGDKKIKQPEPVDTPDAKHDRRQRGQHTFAAMARNVLNGKRGTD